MSTLEVTRAVWRKSSYSGDETNKAQCVELADLTATVGVRDSKAPDADGLAVSRTALFEDIKGGKLDM